MSTRITFVKGLKKKRINNCLNRVLTLEDFGYNVPKNKRNPYNRGAY